MRFSELQGYTAFPTLSPMLGMIIGLFFSILLVGTATDDYRNYIKNNNLDYHNVGTNSVKVFVYALEDWDLTGDDPRKFSRKMGVTLWSPEVQATGLMSKSPYSYTDNYSMSVDEAKNNCAINLFGLKTGHAVITTCTGSTAFNFVIDDAAGIFFVLSAFITVIGAIISIIGIVGNLIKIRSLHAN